MGTKMSVPSTFALARHWIAERAAALGLLIAAILFVGLAFLAFPSEPASPVYGRVTGFGLSESDTGSYPRAVVQLSNGSVSVNISRAHTCYVGAAIKLRCQRHLWGTSCRSGSCDFR